MCSRVWTTCTRVFWLYIRNVHMFTVTAHTPVHLHCVWSHRLCSHRFSVWTNEDWTTRWHKVWSDVGLTAVLHLSSLLPTSYLGCFLSFGAADDVGSGLVQRWTLLKLQNNSCWINPLTKKQRNHSSVSFSNIIQPNRICTGLMFHLHMLWEKTRFLIHIVTYNIFDYLL